MSLFNYIFLLLLTTLIKTGTSENIVSPIRPLYTCDPFSSSITLSSWYYSCKHSCSPFSNQNLTSIAIYKDHYYNLPWNVFLVENRRITVSSHTDILDNCMYIESSVPYIPNSDDIKLYSDEIEKAKLEYPNNKTLYLGSKLKPECSYFRDLYTSYDLLIAQKVPGYLVTESGIPQKIRIPSLESEVSLTNNFALYGNQWLYWDDVNTAQKTGCSITLISQETCLSHENISVIICQNSGYSFKLSDALPSSTCKGNLTYVGEGIFISVLATNVHNNYKILSQSALKIQDSDTSNLVAQMNTIYGTFTDTLCESICDISDQLYSISENSSSVLETPLGPWLGWRNPERTIDHIYYVSSCSRTSEWQLSIPLNICPNNLGFTISNPAGRIYLWDPSKTYFVPQDTCSDFPTSSFFDDIHADRDIKIPFWGRNLIIHSPYNNTYTWLENNSPIHRSSKWTPFISGYQINSTKDIEEILDSFSYVINDQIQIHQARGNLSSSSFLGLKNLFKNSISGIYQWASTGIESLSDFFSLGLKLLFLISIGGIIWLIYLIIKLVYYSTKKYSPVPRSARRQESAPDYQIVRRGEFNPFEMGPAPRRSHRISVEE